MGEEKKRIKRWKTLILIGSIITLILSLTIICLANIRNDQLFKLLDTYPGERHLYLGHDLCTGFSAFMLAVSLVTIIYTIIKFRESKKTQAIIIFMYIFGAVATSGSAITVYWSTNAGTQADEHQWKNQYNDIKWKHSTAWDWMTQTFYYDYDHLWKNLMKENECCGVRGNYEMGNVRALWNNKTDLYSEFNFPLECCKLDTSKDQNVYDCLKEENQYTTGCYEKVTMPQFIPVASVALALAAFSILKSCYMTYFYIYYHSPLYKS